MNERGSNHQLLKLNKKMDNRAEDKLFIGLMVLIVCICVYNAVRAFIG